MAWSCANETPIKLNMLYRYLHYIDPAYMESNPDVFPYKEKNACYYDTFAVTVTWMRFMTGEMNIATGDAVSEADLSADLSALFLGFIYDHLLFHCRVEHLTLDWLEWHTVVGWSWYRYNHYIKGTVVSSVTGILSDDGVYDPYLEASMGNINHMAYYIARFLHERHQ